MWNKLLSGKKERTEQSKSPCNATKLLSHSSVFVSFYIYAPRDSGGKENNWVSVLHMMLAAQQSHALMAWLTHVRATYFKPIQFVLALHN